VLKNVGILSLHQTKTVKMETISTLTVAAQDVFEKQDGHVHGWSQDQSACQYAETDFELLLKFVMMEDIFLITEGVEMIAKGLKTGIYALGELDSRLIFVLNNVEMDLSRQAKNVKI